MTERRGQPTNRDIQALIEGLTARFEATERERDAYRVSQGALSGQVANTLRVLGEAIERIEDRLGEEPDSDGNGGRGLVGDVRRQRKDIQSLLDIRRMAMGAVVAVSLFGALIVLGVTQWVENVVDGTKAAAAAVKK